MMRDGAATRVSLGMSIFNVLQHPGDAGCVFVCITRPSQTETKAFRTAPEISPAAP